MDETWKYRMYVCFQGCLDVDYINISLFTSKRGNSVVSFNSKMKYSIKRN